MEVIEAIKSRRSIRKFKPDPIPDQYVTELLEAARLAPSGSNLQPWRYVVIKSEEGRTKLNEGTPMTFVPKAPVVLVCCIDTDSMATAGTRARELKEAGAFLGTPLEQINLDDYSKKSNTDEVAAKAYMGLNAAIAIDHITLRATELGLGSCWVMMFDQEKIKKAVGLEDRYNVVALIPVGYPDQIPAPRPRLSMDEIVLKEL